MKKNSSKTKKIFIAIAACFSVFLIIGIAYATYVYNEGVRANSTASMKNKTEVVDASGAGWNIRNTTGLDYFVPNKTQTEFNSFKTAANSISNLNVCRYHDHVRCLDSPTSAVYWFDSCGYRGDKIINCCSSYGGCLNSYECNKCTYSCNSSDETSGNCEDGGPLCHSDCTISQTICEGNGMVFTKTQIYGGTCIGYHWTCKCP